MIISVVCPDSFNDYKAIENVLKTYDKIDRIICATSNAFCLTKLFASIHTIELYHEKKGGPTARLRNMVEEVDEVILFEYTDNDSKKRKFSRTQYALNYAKKIDKKLHLIEYDRNSKENEKANNMQNATCLFRDRTDDFRHSESKWSAFAQMAFIWMSAQKRRALNVYSSQYKSDQTNWLKKENTLRFTSWTAANSIVEGQIDNLFSKKIKSNMQPDIVLFNEVENKETEISIIEVKTVGSSVHSNITKYKELEAAINTLDGFTCKLYYLMSYGNESVTGKHLDWTELDEVDASILLWEDLFLNLENSCPLMEYVTPLCNSKNWKKYMDERFN